MKKLKDYEYYRTDLGIQYCGNCLEIMPLIKEKVDLVLTDPPYGINFQSNYRINKHDKIINDSFLPLDLIKIVINKATYAAYIFCRWDNLRDMPKPKSVLSWIKNNWSMGDLKHEHGRQWEACCFYPKEKHQFIKRIPDVLFANRTDNKLHPTQKPVDLFIQIIQCNVCNLVLDPFLGSGTTAVACEKLNRRWIGIEISEKYCEIAKHRIKAEVDQMKLGL
jgi:site-specific DNA-methyltransferase (adenine-specific)